MRIEYDADSDTLTIALREGSAIDNSVEHPEDVILDYDAAGELVSIEILFASRHVGSWGAIALQRDR